MTFTKLDLSKYENNQIITDEEAVFFQKFFKNVKLPIVVDLFGDINENTFTAVADYIELNSGVYFEGALINVYREANLDEVKTSAYIGIYEDNDNKFHIKWGEF